MARVARALLPFALLPHTAAWHPTFQWVLDTFYYTTSSLPSADDSGSNLVPDPRIGRQGPTCLCDVTVGRCDTGCCCDSDCSYEAIRLGGYFGCTSNGTVVEISSFTTCSDQLVATNIPQHLEHSGVVRAFGGSNGLLCIERDNSPSRGTFYQGTGSKSPSQVEAMIDAQFGFYSTLEEASSQEVGRYELRDPVKGDGCISAASTDGCASIFDFQLPAVAPDGGCGGKQLLPFLVGVQAFACDLGETGATLESVCSNTLNASFLSRIKIYKQPSGGAPADVRFVMTGSSVPGSAPVGSSYVPGQCSNAMVLYQLRLVVSPAGAIENVTVYVHFDTLTEANWRDATPIFGAAFEYSQAAGVTRETSGRPGYQRGLPLLVADPTGIGLRVNGLQLLPRTPMGECSTTGTHGATQVLWREATAVTCTTRLTASDFPGWCQPIPNPDPNVFTQPLLASLNVTSDPMSRLERVLDIGVYGDSHPSTTADWMPLRVRFDGDGSPSRYFANVPAGPRCENVVTGIHLRVLYTKVGSYSAPIEKVVGAELVLEQRTVPIARCRGLVENVENCMTTVSVTATTTFVEYDATRFDFVPESPTIIPRLPYDFFYPFN